MDSSFYEFVELIEATHSAVALGVLLSAARAHFEGTRLAYLERLVGRRLAEVGASRSDTLADVPVVTPGRAVDARGREPRNEASA